MLIQTVNELLDQATPQQRFQFYEKIMASLSTEPTYSKIMQFTKPPTMMRPRENNPNPIG
ncbi:hypothetical protein E6H12_01480 [Candidatus Bathyarchaeota archaeon]|nr:MAG: hypothetical protein E6H12_01480 [Candidatus Bathyarchaeota archaeon]